MRAFVVDTMLCCLPEKLWEEAHVVVRDKHVLMTMARVGYVGAVGLWLMVNRVGAE